VVARSASLVAAVLLLSGLTRCAIDDRDLDETEGEDDTGGSSNGGSSNGGTSAGSSNGGSSNGGSAGTDPACEIMSDDSACSVCTKTFCCDEFATCVYSPNCSQYVACIAECLDDACVFACDDSYPEGSAEFRAIVSCGEENTCGCT
jgi:hypothetical protein